MLDAKEEERLREEGRDRDAEKIAQLEQRLNESSEMARKHEYAANVVQGFIDAGIASVDDQGQVVPNQPANASDQIPQLPEGSAQNRRQTMQLPAQGSSLVVDLDDYPAE
jgi:hypothetical protein